LYFLLFEFFRGLCPRPASGIKEGFSGNNTNADGIKGYREAGVFPFPWPASGFCSPLLEVAGDPLTIQYNELVQDLILVPVPLGPFFYHVFTGRVKHLL
jgi:hypothetical protein